MLVSVPVIFKMYITPMGTGCKSSMYCCRKFARSLGLKFQTDGRPFLPFSVSCGVLVVVEVRAVMQRAASVLDALVFTLVVMVIPVA